MPRKSAAELAITPATTAARPHLSPPSSLSTAERLEFIALADENRHLRRTDAPMLACYVMAVTKVQKLSRGRNVALWERATKTMLALARSMRLTQQAQRDPKVVGRMNGKPDAAAILEEMNRAAFDDYERPSSDFRSEAQKAAGDRFHEVGGDDPDA
jgi:hypothetical protein